MKTVSVSIYVFVRFWIYSNTFLLDIDWALFSWIGKLLVNGNTEGSLHFQVPVIVGDSKRLVQCPLCWSNPESECNFIASDYKNDCSQWWTRLKKSTLSWLNSTFFADKFITKSQIVFRIQKISVQTKRT